MMDRALVQNIGHFDDAMGLTSSEGLEGMEVKNV